MKTGSNLARYAQYFDQLFQEANLPGPDYFEFSKMTEAMSSLADERARYCAAFAGLQAQGLDKQKLLGSATTYLQVMEKDETSFSQSVAAARQEEVQGRQSALEEKRTRIRKLSEEIAALQSQLGSLEKEIAEQEEKIRGSAEGYHAEWLQRKERIRTDMEKISQYIL